jgi:hypothetical protein
MNGKIYFNDLKELAEFLNHFAGSTAIFEVKQEYDTKRWVLTFLGGF